MSVTDNDSLKLETVNTRNEPSAEELTGKIHAALGVKPPTDEERERRGERFSLYWEARRAAKVCGTCGTTFGVDDRVFLASLGFGVMPACEGCAPKRMVELRGRGEHSGGCIWYYPEWPCPTCERSVVFRASESQYHRRKHAFCSERCSQIHHNRQRSVLSQASREKVCEVCDSPFTATRSDAKTCGPACKQRAYRRRQKPTRVVNVKSGETYDLYIGWENGRYRLKRSDWRNPFKIGKDGTREEVIAKYERYLLEERPDLVERLPELRGRVLACWCSPQKCHGDVLVRLSRTIV